MPETAEEFCLHLTTNRNCTLEITNMSSKFCLTDPKVFMESGFSFNPPQPTVRFQKTEVCSFTKDDNTATGCVGVLTYELFDMEKRRCDGIIAVMFSVPYDYNFYKNWLSIGIFEPTCQCDEALYKLMYYNESDKFCRSECNGCELLYKGNKEVELRATMSNAGRAICKLELYDH